ncbi:MAG: hypothetical protein KAW61_09040, partial [candidate division Zixibacteria bacterium]|nr:hypothetical protein [candidate division Zixibacteria bacterium]
FSPHPEDFLRANIADFVEMARDFGTCRTGRQFVETTGVSTILPTVAGSRHGVQAKTDPPYPASSTTGQT